MTSLSELWKQFRLLSDMKSFSEEELDFLYRFLQEEQTLREKKRIAHLMRMSGIRRVKLIQDFDWLFNPRIPKAAIDDFMAEKWLKGPANLTIIGPPGVGKSHIAQALCYDAVMKGKHTIFTTLFDLACKLEKAKSVYSVIDYYAKAPVLCMDELGYVFATREQADCIFQIISKRAEVQTTIITTNLIPSQWGKVFDSATATAILDRLSMNGTFLTFEGRSYRSRK